LIEVKVIPKSTQSRVAELSDGKLKVWVHSAPEKGKANQEVRDLVAKHLHISRSRIRLIKGEHSRTKIFALDTDSD